MLRRTVWWLLLWLLPACAGTSPANNPPPAPTAAQAAFTLPPGFDVEGHRGARGLKPENTLPAFETALDLGVTTLELDLHYSADGVLVIWHDAQIAGDKCGLDPQASSDAPDPNGLIKRGADLMISQLTFAQLQAYRCDRNPDPGRFPQQSPEPTLLAGDDYGLLSLAELFDFVSLYSQSAEKSAAQRQGAARVQFNVETKRDPDQPKTINDGFDGEHPGPFELALLQLVAGRGLEERVIVQSFDHRSLWAIRSVNPTIRLAALTTRREVPAFADFQAHQATIWSPDFGAVTPARLTAAHDAGLLVIPWTVNEPGDVAQMLEMGVDGLITDRPDRVLAGP